MGITIKEATIVRPARETPKVSLWNSSLDLLSTRYHVPMVYYYKPNGSSDFFDTASLKEALSEVLVPFYPSAGRLGFDKNGRLEIICNGQGVLFVVAESRSVMENLIGDFSDDSQVYRLIPKVDYSGGISSFPLLVLQVTKFKCGGVCVGVGTQHTLVDGAAAMHFVNSWADTARGLSLAVTPFIDRALLRARDPLTPKFYHVEYDPSPPMKFSGSESHQSNDPKPSVVSTFKLTLGQLNALEAKVNVADANNGKKYTTFTILAAHIWRCISKARGLSDDQPTKIYVPVDGRSRLNPPLPPGYFGNVIFTTAQITHAGVLKTESLTDTVKRIHEQLTQSNDEYLRSALDYVEKVSDLNALVRGPHTFRSPNLNVNTWMRLPMYDADFGWGRPIYMGPGNVVQEGKVIILPSPTNDGSVSVVARLETSHMKHLEKLLYEFPREKQLSRI